MGTIGEVLRSAREARGWSVQDVYERTRISRGSIEAMEADDFSGFAGPVYARMFLRDYCRALDVDEGPLLQMLTDRVAPLPKPPPVAQDRPLNPYWLVLAICTVIIGLAVVKFARSKDALRLIRPPERTASQRAPAVEPRGTQVRQAPVESPPDRSAVAPKPLLTSSGEVSVRLRAAQPAWVKLSAGNKLLFEGILQTGAVKEWTSREPVRVRTGNAGGLYLALDGQPEELMGEAGQIAERLVRPSGIAAPEGP